MNRIERLTAALLLLQERDHTSEEIAQQFGVSRRTVIRDIQSLSEIGVPITAKPGASGGYGIAFARTLHPLHLTGREAVLLMLAMEGLSKMADTPFIADRASLMAKLRAVMPASQQERVAKILETVHIDVPERTQRAPLLDHFLAVIAEGAWASGTYRASEGPTQVKLQPRKLFASNGFWYLDAQLIGGRKTFRIDRFESIAPCEAPSELVSESPPYNDPSHPRIRIQLSAKAARSAQSEPHLGRYVFPDADGSANLDFHCPPSEINWYAKYFGSMGRDAKVISPPELVERICAIARENLENYSD